MSQADLWSHLLCEERERARRLGWQRDCAWSAMSEIAPRCMEPSCDRLATQWRPACGVGVIRECDEHAGEGSKELNHADVVREMEAANGGR